MNETKTLVISTLTEERYKQEQEFSNQSLYLIDDDGENRTVLATYDLVEEKLSKIPIITVDMDLSGSSSNPIANSAVVGGLEDLEDRAYADACIYVDQSVSGKLDAVLHEPPGILGSDRIMHLKHTLTAVRLSTVENSQGLDLSYPVLSADATIATTKDVEDGVAAEAAARNTAIANCLSALSIDASENPSLGQLFNQFGAILSTLGGTYVEIQT